VGGTESPGELPSRRLRLLRKILLGWIFEGPAEFILTDAMVKEVLTVLKGRPDADALADLIREVSTF